MIGTQQSAELTAEKISKGGVPSEVEKLGSYARFNPGRRPEFRLFTTRELHDGRQMFCKVAESDRALPFLLRHIESYARIQAIELPFTVMPPVVLGPRKLGFVASDGASLEAEALRAIREWNRERFLRQFERYLELIDLLPRTVASMGADFQAVFGALFGGERECSIVGFVDLGLDHLYLAGDSRSIIDYEWTFPFPVPIALIKFRAIVGFYTRHRAYFAKKPLVAMPELLAHAGIDEQLCAQCVDAEFNFQRYVNVGNAPQLRDPEQFRKSFEMLAFQTAGLTPGIGSGTTEVEARTSVIEDQGIVVALKTRLSFLEEENRRKQEWIQKLEDDNGKLRWDISSLSEVKDRWIEKLEGDINELRRDCIGLIEDRDRKQLWAQKVEQELSQCVGDLERVTQHKQTLLGELLQTKGELFRALKQFESLSSNVGRLVRYSPQSFPLPLRPVVRALALFARPQALLALPAPEAPPVEPQEAAEIAYNGAGIVEPAPPEGEK